ncbi:MAG: extracellular solute-binding protein [Ruminococcaceae bacterium]|nr:extracellular solute-binding protein [Oscillospiraceae bacterium]
MKKLLSLFLALLLLTALAGCHGARGLEPFAIPAEFDMTRDYEITFWAKNDTNLTQVEIYKKAIADFEAVYPNITVNLRLYTDYGKIYNDVITNIATQTTPNVCITYPDHIATYLTGTNIVIPLDELMADERWGLGGSEVKFDGPTADEIVPKFLGECAFGGSTYALPFMRSTEACYVNKTYVEALGYTLPEVLTWDFVFEVSAAASSAKDADGTYRINGQKVLLPFIYKSTDNMMIQMLAQLDAGYSTDGGDILIFNDETKELLKTIAGYVGKDAFDTFKINGYPANYLNAGQCIFAIDSTAGATWMGSDAPLCDIAEDAIVQFETEVMMIPQFDPKHPEMISQGPSVCVFNKEDPQEVMASWLFTQFLLTNSVQLAYSGTEGYAPVTTKALESAEYKDYLAKIGTDGDLHYNIKILATRLLLDNVENTFVTPVFNGSASLRNAAGQMIENTTKAVMRGQTVDDAFYDTLYSDMISLYRLDQIDTGSGSTAGKAELGPLPTTAVVLIGALICAWVLILTYVGLSFRKKLRK